MPEPTVAQRVSRAEATVRGAGGRFTPPDGPGLLARLDVVHQVLHLMFTERYAASSGPALRRPELTAEALRLTRAPSRAPPSVGVRPGAVGPGSAARRACGRCREVDTLPPTVTDRSIPSSEGLPCSRAASPSPP